MLNGGPRHMERVLPFKSTQAPSHATVYANVLSGYIGPRGDLILDSPRAVVHPTGGRNARPTAGIAWRKR